MENESNSHKSQQLKYPMVRAVQGSVRVGFVPNLELTRRNRVGKKCTRRRPAEVIGLDGSDHQRVAGGSIGVIDLRTRRENGEKNINLAKKPRFWRYFSRFRRYFPEIH